MITIFSDTKCEKIKKGWGEEVILHNGGDFCSKILSFNSGQKASLHYHVHKSELFRVLSGKFIIKTINPQNAKHTNTTLHEGDNVYIPFGHAHQLHCLIEGDIMECSTFDEVSDSYRIFGGASKNKGK